MYRKYLLILRLFVKSIHHNGFELFIKIKFYENILREEYRITDNELRVGQNHNFTSIRVHSIKDILWFHKFNQIITIARKVGTRPIKESSIYSQRKLPQTLMLNLITLNVHLKAYASISIHLFIEISLFIIQLHEFTSKHYPTISLFVRSPLYFSYYHTIDVWYKQDTYNMKKGIKHRQYFMNRRNLYSIYLVAIHSEKYEMA